MLRCFLRDATAQGHLKTLSILFFLRCEKLSFFSPLSREILKK